MKKTNPLGGWLVVIIICIPFIYAATVYPSLPERIPTHFDIHGKPNDYSNKHALWFILLLTSALSAGIYLLIKNLPKIDPKKAAMQSPELYHKIAITIVAFICAISLLTVYAGTGGSMNIDKFMLPLLGLFFAVLGNYMHSVKPNYFVGFRTPWTLESEDNWRKTHRLVSKLWVPGGLLITIGTLILPPEDAFIFLLVILLPMIIIPGVFSYRYFKKQQRGQ